MAVSSDVYSPNEFRLAIKNETASGYANVTNMQLINIDPGSIKVSENVFIANTPRTGGYRVLRASDYFSTEKGSVKTISFSGIADSMVLDYLICNILGRTDHTLPYNHSPAEVKVGDTKTDYDGTITIALISPISGNTRIFPFCVIDELTISADPTVDGGRWHFSAVAIAPYLSTDSQATPSGLSDPGTTIYSFYDTDYNQINSSDVILAKYSVNIKSNAKVFAFDDEGRANIIARALPAVESKIEISAKFDANTKDLFQELADGDSISVLVANQSAATIGFSASYCKLVSEANFSAFNEGTFVDLVFQPTASTSGNVLEILLVG